jgi:putative transposase
MKHELLFKFILFGNRHLDYLVDQFLAYYNGQRAHMERGSLPPLGAVPEEVIKPVRERIEVKSYVGGLVKSFERKAG